MKKIILLATLILFLIPLTTLADEVDLKPQTICPVLGDKIDKSVYTDYQGQRIYFCCKGCIATFKENPGKYMHKIHKDKVLLESVQTKCPVLGGDIDKNVYTDYMGRRVYFCCASCEEEFLKDPGKYLKKMN